MALYSGSEKTVLAVLVFGLFAYLLIQGYLLGRKIKHGDDYMLAGRSLGMFTLVMTLLGTANGGSTLLGFSTQGFQQGFSMLWNMFPAWLIQIIMMFTIVKPIRNVGMNCRLRTVPDFMAMRFGEGSRLPSALSIVIAYCAISGMQFMAIATLFQVVFGMNYTAGLVIGFLFLTFKSFFGGLKSVAWSDRIMGTIQTVGIIALAVVAVIKVGGFGGAEQMAAAQGRPEFVDFANFSLKDTLIWTFTMGGYQLMRPDTWQRFWAAKNGKTAYYGYIINIIGVIITCIAVMLVGTYAGLFFFDQPDLIPDAQLVYYYAADAWFPFWFQAVLVVTLVATVVSCGDSFLLAGSNVMSNDILAKYMKVDLSDTKRFLRVSRLGVWVVAIVGFVMALFITNISVLWTTGTAMMTSAMFLPIICGFYSKKVNKRAGFISCWAGLVGSVVWTIIGSPIMHACFIGMIASVIGLIVGQVSSKVPLEEEIIKNCYFKSGNNNKISA